MVQVLTIPCVYGYAAIIFRDKVYQQDLPELSRLVLFSCAVHQLMFSMLSSLPFSIGQVRHFALNLIHCLKTLPQALHQSMPQSLP